MKILKFVAFSGVARAMMNCGHLNENRKCAAGFTSPHCDTGSICFQDPAADANPCSYSCQLESECELKIWSYSTPDDEGHKVNYCAETPHLPSYSCEIENGHPTVSAVFGPIVSADSSIDTREYELYPDVFEKSDYTFGMFANTTKECNRLINKQIIDGVTRFNFPLNDNITSACGIYNYNYYNKNVDGKTARFQKFEFAIGYENLVDNLPTGKQVVLQGGDHTNIECEIELSDNVDKSFNPEIVRREESIRDGDKVNFFMHAYRTKHYAEKYNENEEIELELRPEEIAPQWVYFQIESELANKFVHIEKCELSVTDKNGEPIRIGSAGDNWALVNNGCVDQTYAKDIVLDRWIWMPEIRIPVTKSETNVDRFGIRIFDLENAASYKVECRVHACDYGTGDKTCQLDNQCPNENRYDALTGSVKVARSRRDAENVKTNSKIVKMNFKHPCQAFSYLKVDYHCVGNTKKNCWLRKACEGRYEKV